MINKRFGILTVIKKTDRRTSRSEVFWRCKCDCGNYTEVPTSHLTSGHTKSCGCQQQAGFKPGRKNADMRNDKIRGTNKTGYKGVSVEKQKDGSLRYRAKLTYKGKDHFSKRFMTIEEAIKARKELEDKYYD